jgi:hypothetical protein
MGTHLRNDPFIQNSYLMGIPYGREPVGNNKDRAALNKPIQGFLDHALRLGIQLGSCFIQY